MSANKKGQRMPLAAIEAACVLTGVLRVISRDRAAPSASSATGVTIAVSLARGASEKNTIVATGLRSTYIASPQRVSAAAIMSRWAMELWVKNTGIECGAEHGRDGDGFVGDIARQAPQAEQRKGCHHQHGGPRDRRREGAELPPERQPQHHQRRMGIGERGIGNERSGQQQVARSGNEVAGLVPEVWQAKQRSMGDEEEGKQEGVGGEILACCGQRTNCFGHRVMKSH